MLRRTILFMALALGACAATPAETKAEPKADRQATPAAAQRFKGVWDFHFETSAFMTEDGQGPYWLSGEGETWQALTAPFGSTGRPWGEVAVEIEGELSASGHYGHLGAYARELRVTRVISARLIRSR